MALARALVRKPVLVLADEPTGNLDRSTAKAVGDLLLELHREQNTILVAVTHSTELAAAFPRIGDTKFRYAPAGVPGDPPFPGDLPSGCPFHPRCPTAADECTTPEPALRNYGDRDAACHRVQEVPA